MDVPAGYLRQNALKAGLAAAGVQRSPLSGINGLLRLHRLRRERAGWSEGEQRLPCRKNVEGTLRRLQLAVRQGITSAQACRSSFRTNQGGFIDTAWRLAVLSGVLRQVIRRRAESIITAAL